MALWRFLVSYLWRF